MSKLKPVHKNKLKGNRYCWSLLSKRPFWVRGRGRNQLIWDKTGGMNKKLCFDKYFVEIGRDTPYNFFMKYCAKKALQNIRMN